MVTGVKFLKSVHSKNSAFFVHDNIKSAHTAISLHRVLCSLLKKRSVDAYVDLVQHCIQTLEIFM